MKLRHACFLAATTLMGQTWVTLSHQPPEGLFNCLLLTDATVICQAGDRTSHAANGNWYKLTPDLTGSYVNGSWSQIASMPAGYTPQAYASAVLADGRAVVMGGEYSNNAFVLSNTGAIYDPKLNSWTSLPPPPGWPYIGDASGIVLSTGEFLIGNKLDTRLARLDPATLTWTVINPAGKSNGFNAEEGWTLLPDGSLLALDVLGAPNTERFLPSLGTWVSAGSTPIDLHLPSSTGPIYIAPGVIYTPPGEMGPALLRPDGTVFAIGGNGHTAIFIPPPANSSVAGSWTRGPDLPGAIDDGPAALLPNGSVLTVSVPASTFWEFDGTNLNPVPAPANAPNDATGWISLMTLPSGQVMFVDETTVVQLYNSSGTYNPVWAPVITSVASTLNAGSTYPVSGTQFNGLSQGSAYGDELQNATNYPMVRITNNATGHVFYARTHGHSSMGVATGATPVSTNFDVPLVIETGASTLSVVANGIPSAAVPVSIAGGTPPPLFLVCPASTGSILASYSSALVATGGLLPYTFSILTGSLGSLVLNSSTGGITGTPPEGKLSFTAKVADSSGQGTTTSCTILISGLNSATFVTADTTTHGSWKGVYGGDGEVVIGDSSALPSYAQLTVGGQVATYTWLPSTTLINAPQKINASDRIAACWYTNGSIIFDLTLAGSTPHSVALYAFDFDAAKRVERIDVLDAVSGLQLDTRTISNFSTGTYLVWNITGHVQFRVTVLSGVNGVISGIFLGGAGAVVPPPVVTQNPSAVSATTGQTATFAVAATGAGLSYQWQSGTASFSNIGGANAASYTTPTLSAADNGTQFRCVVTNTGGSATSTAATLTVTSSGPVITQNPVSVSVTAGQYATFAVAATGTGLSYQWQSGTASFSNIGGANSASYTTPVLSIANSGTQFRCVVTNGGGSATSTAATLTVTTGTSPNGAAFVTTDTTTQGTWRGTYGGDGYLIAGDSTSPPNYGTVSLTGQLPYVWDNLTQAARALQRGSPTATTRIAGVWYSPTSFTIDVTLTSGAHQVALYGLDWDTGNRSERIDVIDPATNQVIDTRTISSFVNGTYLVWNVTGHVQLRVTLLGGLNAVIAGIFFGSGQAAANTQPVITQNPGSATVVAGQTASFTVAATGGGLGYQWQSQAAGGSGFANIGGATGSTYTTPALAITDNGTQYRCLVTNTIGSATSTAATVTVNAAPPGTSAIYVASDTTTQGAWSPTYGTQGTLIAGLAANPPSYAHATMGAVSLWNGGTGSSDPRALNGVIACWYAYPQIVLDLNLTDANYHRIALYLADWGGSRRTQTITIRDAATGAVLDTRPASDFLNGQYLTWNIRGHVMITIAVNSGPNAVLSGVFFQ